MGRFLFALALIISSGAVDPAFAKAARCIYSLRAHLRLLNYLPQVNSWPAADTAVTVIA